VIEGDNHKFAYFKLKIIDLNHIVYEVIADSLYLCTLKIVKLGMINVIIFKILLFKSYD